MFVPRRAFLAARRLPIARSRPIAPLLRYSTESASPAPSTTEIPKSTASPPSQPAQTSTEGASKAAETGNSSGDITIQAPEKDFTKVDLEFDTESPPEPQETSQAGAKTETASKDAPRSSAKPAVTKTYSSRAAPRETLKSSSRSSSFAKSRPVPVKPRSTLKPTASESPSANVSSETADAAERPFYKSGAQTPPPPERVASPPVWVDVAVPKMGNEEIPWEHSWAGIGTMPVTADQSKVLSRPLRVEDVEVKPDGIIYLPEVKYRRRLNEAFGPMGWGVVPRGDAAVGQSIVTREYALIVYGRLVSQAQGVNNYFSAEQLPAAIEGCKSNALMRCCKDLGIASELWDPVFIRWFRKHHMQERWVEHAATKKKRTFWYKNGLAEPVYPYKLV